MAALALIKRAQALRGELAKEGVIDVHMPGDGASPKPAPKP